MGLVSPLILTFFARELGCLIGVQVRLVAESLKIAPILPLEPSGSRVMTQNGIGGSLLGFINQKPCL